MSHDLPDSDTDDSQTDRLLVIGPAWVGDMVMAQSLFGLLKARRPDREIEVMAPAWTNPLLARMPEVSARLEMPLGHGQFSLKQRYRLGVALRGRYQEAIVLPNSWKSALVPLFAQIPQRIGWRGEMRFGLLNDIRLLNKQRYPLMVERFLALGLKPGAPLPKPLPAPRLVAYKERLPELYEKFAIAEDRPVLALCPGAEFGPAKQWPPAHYARVAAAKIAEGWQVWLMGSAKDQAAAQAIVAELSPAQQAQVTVLAGRTGLDEAIDLLSSAAAVVSNDSGLMHIAAALERPLVAVYGSTSPGFTPPLGERVTTQSIPVDCGPCFQRECPLGHLKCLVDLSPKQVLAGLEQVLAEQPAAQPVTVQSTPPQP